MTRTTNLVLMTAALLTGVFFASPALAVEWSWTTSVTPGANGDVWLQSAYGGQPMYSYRLGAGGALSNMNNVPTGQSLLSPSYSGEVTDRVVQWTAWSNNIKGPTIPDVVYDNRYNVTQAGTAGNVIAPTMSVVMRPGSNVVDVYSVPREQFNTVYDSLPVSQQMQSKISCLTRYEMLDQGVLKIRRVMRVGDVTVNGVLKTSFDDLYMEGWTPFLRSTSTFDSMALGVNAAGTPTWSYQAGSNIPFYPETQVDTTNGYAVVYKSGAPASSTAVGVIYGTKQMVAPISIDNAVLNSMDWDTGIGVLPGLHMYAVPTGSIIDQTLLLVPRSGLNAEMSSLLTSLVPTVPAPRLYGPYTAFTGELAGIVAELNANLNLAGVRTDHLAGLVTTAPEPGTLVLLASGLIGLLAYVWRKRK